MITVGKTREENDYLEDIGVERIFGRTPYVYTSWNSIN